ncbi:MAG: hypothetical protein ACPL3E_01675, partial [Minisyncoccia bacterium]
MKKILLLSILLLALTFSQSYSYTNCFMLNNFQNFTISLCNYSGVNWKYGAYPSWSYVFLYAYPQSFGSYTEKIGLVYYYKSAYYNPINLTLNFTPYYKIFTRFNNSCMGYNISMYYKNSNGSIIQFYNNYAIGQNITLYTPITLQNINFNRFVYINISLISKCGIMLINNDYISIAQKNNSLVIQSSTPSASTTTTTTTTTIQYYNCNQSGFWFKCMQNRFNVYIPNWKFHFDTYLSDNNYFSNTTTASFGLIKIPYADGMSSTFSDLYLRAYTITNQNPCPGIIDNGRCLIDLGEIPFALWNYSQNNYAILLISNKTKTGSYYNYFYIFYNSPNGGFNNQSLINKYINARNVNSYNQIGGVSKEIIILSKPITGLQNITYLCADFNPPSEFIFKFDEIKNSYYIVERRFNKIIYDYNRFIPKLIYVEWLPSPGGPDLITRYLRGYYKPAYNEKVINQTSNISVFQNFQPWLNNIYINANVNFITKNNQFFITNLDYLEVNKTNIQFGQIESYIPYLNINIKSISDYLISNKTQQFINTFAMFLLLLGMALFVDNEITAIITFIIVFIISLMLP